MNDRYLFKAKTCNGEWVTGLLSHKDKKYYISNKAGMPFAFEVRPDAICQCTGLKDRNGKLIWENDVVRVDTKKGTTLCVVKFANAVAQFQLWQNKTLPNTPTALNLGNYTEEVIGSSIDNPVLLEVE